MNTAKKIFRSFHPIPSFLQRSSPNPEKVKDTLFKPLLNINIIEDNVTIRNVLRQLLVDIDPNINVFSSGNGLHGLGEILISRPQVVIVDSTLPEFSGLELINYLNENIEQYELFTKLSIIVLDDGAIAKLTKEHGARLSPKYTVFDKRDKNFVKNFTNHLKLNLEYLRKNESLQTTKQGRLAREEDKQKKQKKQKREKKKLKPSLKERAFLFICQRIIRIATKREQYAIKFKRAFFLNQTRLSVMLACTFIYLGILVLTLDILTLSGKSKKNKKTTETNIPLLKKDYAYFRTAKYSILIPTLLVLLFVTINLFLLIYGGVTINNRRVESIFANWNTGDDGRQPASVTEIVVNSTGDESDHTLNGECSVGAATGGLCTLRAAIEEANNGSDSYEIVFALEPTDPGYINPDGSRTSTGEPAGTYTAKNNGYYIIEAGTQYDLNGSISINGYSQTGASRNTVGIGGTLNTELMVQIRSGGRVFYSNYNSYADLHLSGLNIIGSLSQDSPVVETRDTWNLWIEGNYINTSIDGTEAYEVVSYTVLGLYNNVNGATTVGTNLDNVNDIGEKNLISGLNPNNYLHINQELGALVVSGNYIGTDKTGNNCIGTASQRAVRVFSWDSVTIDRC